MGGSDGCFFSQCCSDRKNSKLDNVHFANSKLYYRFERINKLDCDYSY